LNAAVASAVDPEQLDILKGISDLICNGVNGDWQHLRPAQILTAFPSVRMTLKKVLPTIAPMKKRYYSISSSPLALETETQIASVTVGVVEGTSPKNPMILAAQTSPQTFRGVSSGYLADLRLGQLAEVSVVRNERFRLPKNSLAPVIMIDPGTGIAPFRGFIQELNMEADQHRQAMLFFGCRNEKDYLYRSELESASIELYVAFSRPDTGVSSQNDSKTPQYVQDSLWENRDRVWQLLLEEGAYIYVCGDGRHMAKDVDATLCRIAVESGNMNENDAIAYFEQLQKNGGYLQDVWCD
jgi:sulfite reductase alpha subunit-like flavoprotein